MNRSPCRNELPLKPRTSHTHTPDSFHSFEQWPFAPKRSHTRTVSIVRCVKMPRRTNKARWNDEKLYGLIEKDVNSDGNGNGNGMEAEEKQKKTLFLFRRMIGHQFGELFIFIIYLHRLLGARCVCVCVRAESVHTCWWWAPRSKGRRRRRRACVPYLCVLHAFWIVANWSRRRCLFLFA